MKNSERVIKGILMSICAAQIGSDSGKSIYELEWSTDVPQFTDALENDYESKSGRITQAIRLINLLGKESPVRYFVSKERLWDSRNRNHIVYFDINVEVNGVVVRGQVSFHAPGFSIPKALLKCSGKGCPTKWASWQASRDVCQRIIDCYGL